MKESAPSDANDLDNKLGSAASERGKIQSMCSEREARICLLTWAFTDPWSDNSTFWLLEQAKRLAAEPLDLFDARESSVGGRVGEWKYLRNGRLGFSCTFSRGDGRVDCVSSVDETDRVAQGMAAVLQIVCGQAGELCGLVVRSKPVAAKGFF
jgi:hypothetical protein